jgi:hypothetical protein
MTLGRRARALRVLHSSIGVGELACLAYLWLCAIRGRRDRWLRLSTTVLLGEGAALVAARGCPLGGFQRRAGDEVPMFELWFGPRLAPFAIPTFTVIAGAGMALLAVRRPAEASVLIDESMGARTVGDDPI